MNTAAYYSEEIPEDDETFDQPTFNSGIEKRVSVIMLLDTSSSMAPLDRPPPKPIDQLNHELNAWAEEIRADSRLRHRAEVAILTFGHGGVVTHQLADDAPFAPAALFHPPTLIASGVTPMLAGIREAIKISQQRKAYLDTQMIRRFRPLIFMLTDGAPTDDYGAALPADALKPTAQEIAAFEARKQLAFFAVGVRGADVHKLRLLAPNGYWDLGAGNFSEFLRLMSTSAGKADPLSHARDEIARLMQGEAQ